MSLSQRLFKSRQKLADQSARGALFLSTKAITTITMTMTTKTPMTYVVSADRANSGLLDMAEDVGVVDGCEDGVRVEEGEGAGVEV